MAAPVAERRGARRAARLLAPAAGRGAGGPRAAGRPAAAGGAEPARRHPLVLPAGGALGRPRGARSRAGGHPLHGAAGGARCPLPRLERTDRPRPRLAGRQPQPAGDRRAGGLLRQHPGAARRPRRRSELPGAAGPGARDDAGGLRPPGPAVREAGRGGGARAQPRPRAAVPGPARLAERATGGGGAAGADPGATGGRGGNGEVRPQLRAGRGRRGPRRTGRVRRRPLRRHDRRPLGAPLRAPAGGRGGRAGRPSLRAFAALGGRAPPDPGGVERHPRGVSGDDAAPPVLRGGGGALAGIRSLPSAPGAS